MGFVEKGLIGSCKGERGRRILEGKVEGSVGLGKKIVVYIRRGMARPTFRAVLFPRNLSGT